jgi:hypothetical protein
MNGRVPPPLQQPMSEARPSTEPLREYGIGPAMLVFYSVSLVVIHFLLVGLGPKSALQSC